MFFLCFKCILAYITTPKNNGKKINRNKKFTATYMIIDVNFRSQFINTDSSLLFLHYLCFWYLNVNFLKVGVWSFLKGVVGGGGRGGGLRYHIPTQNLTLNPCPPAKPPLPPPLLSPSSFTVNTLDLLILICITASLPWQIRKTSWQ